MDPIEPFLQADRRADYALSVEATSALFSRAGVPRSPRTVMRYCANGHLDCQKVDTERNEKYLVSRESVDRKIQELPQAISMLTRPDASDRDTAGHDSSQRDTSHQDETAAQLEARVRELEAEIIDLRITNRAKDQFIEAIRHERTSFLEQLTAASREIGQLETRIRLALNSGTPPASPNDAQIDDDVGYPHDALSETPPSVVQ